MQFLALRLVLSAVMIRYFERGSQYLSDGITLASELNIFLSAHLWSMAWRARYTGKLTVRPPSAIAARLTHHQTPTAVHLHHSLRIAGAHQRATVVAQAGPAVWWSSTDVVIFPDYKRRRRWRRVCIDALFNAYNGQSLLVAQEAWREHSCPLAVAPSCRYYMPTWWKIK